MGPRNKVVRGMKPLLKDNGEPFTEVLEYDGYLFPNMLGCQQDIDVAEYLASIDELGFEGDEMCIVSYPRSGTHWTYEICNMIKTGRSDFTDTLMPMLEYSPREHLKTAQATNRIYSSHMYPKHMPKQFMAKRCKIIQVYRNPKDVAVSLFNFSKKVTHQYSTGDMGFSEYLRHYRSGNVLCRSWAQWIQEWNIFKKENPDYPLLQIAYEDMKKDLKESVQRISDFLCLNSTPQLIEDIADKCEFNVMAAHKNSNIPQNMELITDIKNTHVFYGKGGVGEWKNHFTVAENEAFDKDMETILPELSLNITYEL